MPLKFFPSFQILEQKIRYSVPYVLFVHNTKPRTMILNFSVTSLAIIHFSINVRWSFPSRLLVILLKRALPGPARSQNAKHMLQSRDTSINSLSQSCKGNTRCWINSDVYCTNQFLIECSRSRNKFFSSHSQVLSLYASHYGNCQNTKI